MAIAPNLQVLYRRLDDILFGWVPLLKTEAKSYNLYSCSTPTGIYTLFESGIKNEIDKNYKNKVVALVKDTDIPIPSGNIAPSGPPGAKYYFKLTFVDPVGVESDIALSAPCIVYPAGVANIFENEHRDKNNHNFGWVETKERWEKVQLTDEGKLMVDATLDAGSVTIGNVKIATRPDGSTLEFVLVDNSRRVVTSNDPNVLSRVRQYQEAVNVLPNTETTLLTYTNAAAFFVDKVSCSGTADAVFKLKVNGITQQTLRNSWNNRNVTFDFITNSSKFSAGNTITVTVSHVEQTSHDYEATLMGYTYTY